MRRRECVVCTNTSLTEFYTLKDYPITPSSGPFDMETDEFQDCTFATCNKCGTIQLINLIDPVKLYKNSHNSTENTPTWKEHHTLFSEFISVNADTSAVLEIGGNSGVLYKLLSQRFPKYTILDICDNNTRPAEVEFLYGNCEDYDFIGHNHVVLSHTFEHLYNPRRFIENLSNAVVNNIYISIPNMEHLYDSKNISIIHNEHTFFVSNAEIQYLFSQYGYSCSSTINFKKHSIFYHFIYTPSIIPKTICKVERHLEIAKWLSDFEEIINNIKIDRPTFICPAGHYGQKIYHYIRCDKKYIKGFIDNDISKQKMRVYGTSCYVYPADILIDYKDISVSCILYAGPYTNELKQQLNSIHPNINFINLVKNDIDCSTHLSI